MTNFNKTSKKICVFAFIFCCCAFLTNAQEKAGTGRKNPNSSLLTTNSVSPEQAVDSDINPALAFYIVLEVQGVYRGNVINQIMEIIRKRLKLADVSAFKVERESSSTNRIIVKLSPLNNPSLIKWLISSEARFEIVHAIGLPQPMPITEYATKDEAIRSLGKTIPPNRRVIQFDDESIGSEQHLQTTERWIVVESPTIINESDLADCQALLDSKQNNYYKVSCILNDEGNKNLSFWTGQNIGYHMGIVLNENVKQVGYVKYQIRDRIEIEGKYSKDAAEILTTALVSGKFPSPVLITGEGIMRSFRRSKDQNKSNSLVFSSQKDENQEVYQLDLATGRATNLSQSGEDDGYPRCSPDGKKIAFATNRDGYWEVYLMNADGSGQQNLTNNRGGNGYMDWSPDGQALVFASTRNGQKNNEIYTIRADGSGLKRLTNHVAEDVHPAWSPDGKKIAFSSERDGNRQIYVMNADGTNVIRLMNNRWYDDYPAWSPDGSQIAFASDRDSKASDRLDIYVANADGTNIKRITSHPSDDRHPAWSPDGSLIAFASNRDGNHDIYTVHADGTELKKVFSSKGEDEHPHWCANTERPNITSNLFVIKDGGKYGYIDSTGKVVINPQFDEALSFKNGAAVVRIGKKYSLIDKAGKNVIDLPFDKVSQFSEGLARIELKDSYRNKAKVGFINSSGKLVIPLIYDDAHYFSEGVVSVKVGDKWGYIDKTNKFILNPQYWGTDLFSDGLGLVVVRVNDDHNERGFIDRRGKFVINPQRSFLVGVYCHEGLIIAYDQNGNPEKLGFMGRTGKYVIQPQFRNALNFSEGLAAVMIGFDWGYVDKKGNIVIPLKFGFATNFSEGLAAVKEKYGKSGYIDKKGKMIIAPQFEDAGPFINGLAPVNSIERKWGDFNEPVVFDNMAINREGVVIWKALKPNNPH